jgi:hypothetical protein
MLIERSLYSKIKPVVNARQAIVITGMRRVGKTTLLRQIMDEISSPNKIFLDLENPANQKYLEEENYDKILDNLRFLGLDAKKQGYIFLDEIQLVKNTPSIVKYLSDHYPVKFFLSGSSSFYIKNLFSESLSGRKYIFELFPLNFHEFLQLKKIRLDVGKLKNRISSTAFEEINRHYDEYILYGGFPGVVQKTTAKEKSMMLQDIFSSYFQLEVKQLGDFRKTNIFRDLMLLLMERVGSKLDIQKLSRELGVARETIYDYLAFLENTYFLKLIRPMSRNRDSEIRSRPKVYLCDTGLINQFSKVNDGALFENAVFSALRQKGEVNYYQKKSGAEIDFILNKKQAYEVKIQPSVQDLKKLKMLAGGLKLQDYRIVSRKHSGLNHISFGFLL